MYWTLLLDTALTVDQAWNPCLLTNIHKVNRGISVHFNTGTTENTKVCDMGNIEMWLNTKGIANIVLMRTLVDKYHMTFDSCSEKNPFWCIPWRESWNSAHIKMVFTTWTCMKMGTTVNYCLSAPLGQIMRDLPRGRLKRQGRHGHCRTKWVTHHRESLRTW